MGDIDGDMFEKCNLSHLLFHTYKFSDFWTLFSFISMFKINLHELRIAIELFIHSWYLSGKNMSILQNYLWF